MTTISKKILKVLVAVNIIVAALSIIFFDIKIFYNIEIGFISSAMVMAGSLASYRRMVNARVQNRIITFDDSKDAIDKLEDPHDLYSEEIVHDETVDFKEAIKAEKQKLKANRRSFFETLRDTKTALSIYRLGAYAVLILGFLYLNRHGALHVASYLVGLGVPPIIIVAVLLQSKENHSKDTIK
ncbi:MAG: hypothetical protein PHR75_07085 [Sulfurovum sp.]|nr:hypothetical protein [Sulfurovum sp.]MDD3602378.1 hypothetical protein [Sulfurovum sp.]